MLAVLNFSRSLIKRTFFISMALSLLTALVSLASGILETTGSRPPENLVSRQNILFLGSYTHSQDVTTDGENFYFSARWSLTKTTLDGETETAMNINAIPRELKEKYGSAHIGGISYYNGKIYAALAEGVDDYSPLATMLVEAGHRLTLFKEEDINLETAFMALTKGITA